MAKATIKSKSGAVITVEGTEREVSKIVAIVQALRRERESRAPVLYSLAGSACKSHLASLGIHLPEDLPSHSWPNVGQHVSASTKRRAVLRRWAGAKSEA